MIYIHKTSSFIRFFLSQRAFSPEKCENMRHSNEAREEACEGICDILARYAMKEGLRKRREVIEEEEDEEEEIDDEARKRNGKEMAGGSQRSPFLDQISEEEKKLAELRRSKGPFDRSVRTLTTNIRQSYESFIFENLAASEPGEQQLWRLHYSFIEEFRGRLGKLKAAATAAASIPNKKKVVEEAKFQRVGGQYKCFLDEATGFYHGLVAKLRAKHGLPPELSSTTHAARNSKEDLQRCHCVCYRCFIYLGDLARYKELHSVVEGRTADWSVAASYYQQASTIWPAGGNPYNQLGVLATYAGDNLQAMYYYLYSLAVTTPFSTARANIKLLFEKNQQHSTQLSSSPEEDRAIDLQMAQSFESDAFKSSSESRMDDALLTLQRRFRIHFISLIGLLFNESGSEEVNQIMTPILRESHLLLSQDHPLVAPTFTFEKSNSSKNQSSTVLHLLVSLILSIHNVGHKKKKSAHPSSCAEHAPLVGEATKAAFQFVSQLMHHSAKAHQPYSSHLFPAIVVFCRWLASYPDLIEQIRVNEECDRLQCNFWTEACMLLSRCLKVDSLGCLENNPALSLEKTSDKPVDTLLWEDYELQGLVPLKYLESRETIMDTAVVLKGGNIPSQLDCLLRVQRLMKALKSLSCLFKVDSPDFDLIIAVNRSSFGCTSRPFERHECPQFSGGSERSADDIMEVRTQGPQIAHKNVERNLLSQSKDSSFMKVIANSPASLHLLNDYSIATDAVRLTNQRSTSVARAATDQKSDFLGLQDNAGPSCSKITLQLSDSQTREHQQGSIIVKGSSQHIPTTMVERTASQQLEVVLSDRNLETNCEDPLCNANNNAVAATSGSMGRVAVSLGDWVSPHQRSNSDQVEAALVAFNNQSLSLSCRSGAAEQVQADASLVESLSFHPILSVEPAALLEVPSCSHSLQLAAVRVSEVEEHQTKKGSNFISNGPENQLTLLSKIEAEIVNVCCITGVGSDKEIIRGHVNMDKGNMEDAQSRSRKRQCVSYEALERPATYDDVNQNTCCGSDQAPQVTGTENDYLVNGGGIEEGRAPMITEEVKTVDDFVIEHDVLTQNHVSKQHEAPGAPDQPGQMCANHEAPLEGPNYRAGVRAHGVEVVEKNTQVMEMEREKIALPMERHASCPEQNGVGSQSRKRKPETPSLLCMERRKASKLGENEIDCVGDGVGGERQDPQVPLAAMKKDERLMAECNIGASHSRKWRHAPHRAFKGPCSQHLHQRSSYVDERIDVTLPAEKAEKKHQDRGNELDDFRWLDTFTHVVPQALAKLTNAMSPTSFSFSNLGIFCEFGADLIAEHAHSASGHNQLMQHFESEGLPEQAK